MMSVRYQRKPDMSSDEIVNQIQKKLVMSIEEFTDTTENYENRETIMEELERVSEYWYERGEENILTITCGVTGYD